MHDDQSKPDILGPGFTAETLQLKPDGEGDVVATLVRHAPTSAVSTAFLYVHGFTDYFFQRELAERVTDAGYRFYALDLRKCGRSYRPHQSPNFCEDISEYFEDLDTAFDRIAADGCDSVVLNGHSTGGLSTTMWAHDRQHDMLRALVLNSPFLELNANWFSRNIVPAIVGTFAGRRPEIELPASLGSNYAKSVHRDHHGEWEFRLDWKPIEGFPTRAGWFSAIHRAQQKLHKGLAIEVPILVMHSDRGVDAKEWTDEYLRADGVLDPAQIRNRATSLGGQVTMIAVKDGMHDLILSSTPVRERVYQGYFQWLKAYASA